MEVNTVSQQSLETILTCHGLVGGICSAANAQTSTVPSFVGLHPVVMSR